MRKARRAVRVAVSLSVVGVATGVLAYLKLTTGGLHHPIFIYLPLIHCWHSRLAASRR